MRSRIYKLYLVLASIGGALALVFSLRAPAVTSSASRLATSLLIALLTLALACLAVWAFLDRRASARFIQWLDRLMEPGSRLLVSTLVLIAGCLFALTLLIVWLDPQVHDYRWYSGIFKNTLHLYEVVLVVAGRLAPLLVWLMALLFQTLLAFLIAFSSRYRQKEFWNPGAISRTVLVLAMVVFSLLQWAVLGLQVSMHNLLPGWYWSVNRRPFNPRLLLFLALLAVSLGVVRYILRHPKRAWLCLLLLVGLGYLMQVGVGIVQGSGYEYIRMKYAGSKHSSYAHIATGDPYGPLEAVRRYEELYGFKMFPSTKPPGVLMLYFTMEKVVNLFSPGGNADARFLTLTMLLAYIFPLIAFLVIGVMYRFMRPLVKGEHALFPAILYVFVPNVILIPMFLDQALYPMLFMLGIFLMWRVVQTRSVLLAFLAGLYFYVVIFFTFSLLTLLPFFLVLLGLDYLLHRKERSIPHAVLMVAAMGVGIIALFVLMRVGLNYDIFRRYATAMRVVRNFDFILRTGEKVTIDLATQTVQPTFRQILRASFLNNLEFAAAVGFPIFFLFVWRLVRTLLALVRRRAGSLDLAFGAFSLTFIALNLYGQMQGEASRIWIFWVPMVVMFAGVELASQFQRKELALYAVIIMQVITILMIFQFQDFIV